MMLLMLIVGIVSAYLKISKDGVNYQEYNYSLANFGLIPYGHTQSGLLHLPIEVKDMGYDMCDLTNIKHHQSKHRLWYIARRGNCTFTTKALVAEQLGAQLLLIADQSEEVVQGFVMIDDGKGYQVHIPSLFVSKSDGDQIVQDIQELIGKPQKAHGVTRFNDTVLVDNPTVLFGLNIQNRETFKLIRDFKEYYMKLNKTATFDIYYEYYTCRDCDTFDTPKTDCLGGGLYCTSKPETQFGSGEDVAREQLRQQCLWQENQQYWWEYMNKFDENCFNPKEYFECFQRIVGLSMISKVQQCVVNSYIDDGKQQNVQRNKILDKAISLRYSTGLLFYPGVVVNSIPYRGNLESYNIFEDICSGMITQPYECTNQASDIYRGGDDNKTSHIWLIVIVIVGCLLFAIFMVVCYRRRLKQRMQQELGQQVNEMVSQYIKFYETKSDAQQ